MKSEKCIFKKIRNEKAYNKCNKIQKKKKDVKLLVS